MNDMTDESWIPGADRKSGRTEMGTIQELLHILTEKSRAILADRLTGIYLHGSLAMGCFHPKTSDLDLLIVIEIGITKSQKLALMEQIVRLNRQAPPKGIEISVVKREYCKPFIYPTPFELHFSPIHLKRYLEDPVDYVERMNGTDRDLAAHVTVLRHYGVVLWGEPVEEVFGEVSRAEYLDSILFDVSHAKEEIAENPVYVILNLCRALAAAQENLCLSKRDGGGWGLKHLPAAYHDLIAEALACYDTGRTMEVQPEHAAEFAGAMLRLLADAV